MTGSWFEDENAPPETDEDGEDESLEVDPLTISKLSLLPLVWNVPRLLSRRTAVADDNDVEDAVDEDDAAEEEMMDSNGASLTSFCFFP